MQCKFYQTVKLKFDIRRIVTGHNPDACRFLRRYVRIGGGHEPDRRRWRSQGRVQCVPRSATDAGVYTKEDAGNRKRILAA